MDGRSPLLTSAPLCQARTRAGTSCRCPAVRGRARCRLHGGASGSGAPSGERNGVFRHGGRTVEAAALRRAASRIIRECAVR
ncbi:HGGxSTG domain-containing protein [Novosphingobium bradum]|uniref:HGGxSTG domain-containing protein n=1 Tax=Novosphingobium bradum TaxID=1737444 RepID=A0ABV7IXC0_9SPHN